MSVLSCAHTHTLYCDGKNSPREMIEAALERGFVSLGFSAHSFIPSDPGYCMPPEREAEYQREILALKEEFSSRIRIYLGLEWDAQSPAVPAGYDYLIGSVHYVPDEAGLIAVDARPEALRQYVASACQGDGLRLAEKYYAQLQRFILARRPAMIGHFDLLRKHNAALHLFDEESPAYRQIAISALHSLAGSGCLMEMNTGAIARGYLSTPYPAPFLLKEWRRLGGEVIINSDCHDARLLDCCFRECEEMLRSCGYDHAVRLGKNTLWERYPLK